MRNQIMSLGGFLGKIKFTVTMLLLALSLSCYANEVSVDKSNSTNPNCATTKDGISIVVYNKSEKKFTGMNKYIKYALYDASNQNDIKKLDTGEINPMTDIINPDVSISNIDNKTVIVLSYTELWATDEIKCLVGVVNKDNKVKWGKKVSLGTGQLSNVAVNDKGEFVSLILNSATFNTGGLPSNSITLYYNIGNIDTVNKTITGLTKASGHLHDVIVDTMSTDLITNYFADVDINADGDVMVVCQDPGSIENNSFKCLFTNYENMKDHSKSPFTEEYVTLSNVEVDSSNPNYFLDINDNTTTTSGYDFVVGFNSKDGEYVLLNGNALTSGSANAYVDCHFAKAQELNDLANVKNLAMSYLSSSIYFSVFQSGDAVSYELINAAPSLETNI